MGTSNRRDTLRWLVSELKTRFGVTINTGKLNSNDDCIEALYKIYYEVVNKEQLKKIEELDSKVKQLEKDLHVVN